MNARLTLPLLLGLASCASPWTLVSTQDNAALRPGAQVATMERGHGANRERRVDIRADGADVDARTVDRVMSYVLPLDSADAALAYSDLVRELSVADAGARGVAVRPDATLTGRGAGGRYSRSDAAAWGIAFEPSARPYAGGFEVSRVALLAPVPHPQLAGVASPWRLVLVREVVLHDGTIRTLEERTLTDGQDAARFAEL